MDAMTMHVKSTLELRELVDILQADYATVSFVDTGQFAWHAGNRHVSYKDTGADPRGCWALLHELGHALLEHTDYATDIELLQIEVAAWEQAHVLAKSYGIEIDEEYVQDALDSYRDWLHLRSTCPTCHVRSLQQTAKTYACHNCGTQWHVTRSRLCRSYRRKRS